ncbi:ion transporter [Alsobacter metallidurans]|uniref:Ion transporter n=1 Tax=Alsobacter metallidurans TaxID=340221 RepID=A0A917IDV1_9HYPH|nr:hemolysin family protein [Alsobacter metallidurans]GGH34045.1 ion transporter [Alsobacter metallidurans]
MTSEDTSSGSTNGSTRGSGQAEARDTPGESFIDRFLSRLGIRHAQSFRDDLEEALAESGADFAPLERAMLKNVLGLRTHRVDDVMVPRADIVAVPIEITLGELLRVFRTAGHSRLPVYAETLDDPRGMVHIRDFLDYMATRAETAKAPGRRRALPAGAPDLGKVDLSIPLSAAKILRPVLFVPPSMPAMDLLVKMQASRTHMALVIDEYGGTDGLVSIEDLVEIIVGDIEDEHDLQDAPMITKAPDGSYLADARTSLEEASAELTVDLAHGEMAEDVDTLGGLIAALVGRVPVRGEVIAHPAGVEFEILDADPRRIKRLRIHTSALEALPPPDAPLSLPPPRAAITDQSFPAAPDAKQG